MTEIWVGRVTPYNDTEVARRYWGSNEPIKDIIKDLSLTVIPARVGRLAGAAVLHIRCIDCGSDCEVSSRADAKYILETDESKKRRTGKSQHRCYECEQAHKLQRLKDQYAKRKADMARAEELRWMPYRDYLGTDEWSERRKQVIRRADFKCQVCAAGGRLHVHHRTYARRGVEKLEDMIALCADCHELFHAHGRLAENGRAA